MKFDVMRLHVPEEDREIRQCLRAYTILPKYCETPDEKNEKAKEILESVWKIRDKLRAKHGRKWGYAWMEKIPYGATYSVVKDWMIGRASIPLIAIDSLRELGFEKETAEILENVEYVSSTTGDITKIPKGIDKDLAYLTGLILGDGSLPIKHESGGRNHRLIITSGDKKLIEKVALLIERIFEVTLGDAHYYSRKSGSSWNLYKGNKAIYRFFSKIVCLTNGNKAKNGKIPHTIKPLPDAEKVAFIAGLIDSDIGRHGRGMGCTFKSKKLVEDLLIFLGILGIEAKAYGSHYKDNKYLQHDFTIPKSQIKRLKELLVENYLPLKEDRLNTINMLTQG